MIDWADANLKLTIGGTDLGPFGSISSGWSWLRNLRNLSAGHPIENTTAERGRTRRVFVSRPFISPKGLHLIVWDRRAGDSKYEEVDVDAFYVAYKDQAVEYLEEVSAARHTRWPRLSS